VRPEGSAHDAAVTEGLREDVRLVPRKVLVDADQLGRTVARIAHEIVERHADPGRIALVGVHTRGVPLARRLADLIERFAGSRPAFGTVDIALYRDDVGVGGPRRPSMPVVGDTQLDFAVSERAVVLVDDVLYTGRTVRAAIDAVMDYGRPPLVQLAVLIDRGHRELPIRPDYVGKNLPTSPAERVAVRLTEIDGADEVVLEHEGGAP
jgi:pyrimidine operon attenuation protein / uracil phosphoribosyltransferase